MNPNESLHVDVEHHRLKLNGFLLTISMVLFEVHSNKLQTIRNDGRECTGSGRSHGHDYECANR